MIIVNDILVAAFRIAGILRGPKRGLSSSEAQEGLEVMDSLLDSWNAESLCQFNIDDTVYTLPPNPPQPADASGPFWTIGIDPTGAVIATIQAPRPIKITQAAIITQVGSAQATRVILDLLNKDGWAALSVTQTGSSIPTKLYCDYDYPISRLYFYPYPNGAAQLELFTWSGLQLFDDIGTAVLFPPGYRRALEYCLAVDLSSRYPQFQLNPRVERIAREAKSKLTALNAPSPEMSCDPALLSRKKNNWNYMTGLPN